MAIAKMDNVSELNVTKASRDQAAIQSQGSKYEDHLEGLILNQGVLSQGSEGPMCNI